MDSSALASLDVVLEVATDLLGIGVANLFHRRRISAKPVGEDHPRSAELPHDALEKLQRRGLVPLRGDPCFQDLAFVIDSAPKMQSLPLSSRAPRPNAIATRREMALHHVDYLLPSTMPTGRPVRSAAGRIANWTSA